MNGVRYDYGFFMARPNWSAYENGETVVFVGGDGRVEQVNYMDGRYHVLFGDEARAFVAKSGFADDLEAFVAGREEATARWRRETPHKSYGCDRGSVAIRLNGSAVVLVANRSGDGCHRVYRIGADDVRPDRFRFAGLMVEAGTRVEVLPYDCAPYHLGRGPLVPLYDFVAEGGVSFFVDGGDVIVAGGENVEVVK